MRIIAAALLPKIDCDGNALPVSYLSGALFMRMDSGSSHTAAGPRRIRTCFPLHRCRNLLYRPELLSKIQA